MSTYEMDRDDFLKIMDQRPLSDWVKEAIHMLFNNQETILIGQAEDTGIDVMELGPGGPFHLPDPVDPPPDPLTSEDVEKVLMVDSYDSEYGLNLDLANDNTVDTPFGRVAVGSEMGDTIVGGEADLYADGLGGDDLMVGGQGNDSLDGGLGDDQFDLTAGGNDRVQGGEGEDTVTLAGSLKDYDFTEYEGVFSFVNRESGEVVQIAGVEHLEFAGDGASFFLATLPLMDAYRVADFQDADTPFDTDGDVDPSEDDGI